MGTDLTQSFLFLVNRVGLHGIRALQRSTQPYCLLVTEQTRPLERALDLFGTVYVSLLLNRMAVVHLRRSVLGTEAATVAMRTL